MKRSITFFFVIYFIFLFGNIYGQNYLNIIDPDRSWSRQQGTIEKAVISVKPKGIYMEYGLYLTFSPRGTNFNADSLEIEYRFRLPENAIVHDSWLWVEDEIIRAEIMDEWTASQIYEDIVDRRQDPSILFKRSQTDYELRIFPVLKEEERKVKITYLVPTQWNEEKVISPLPTEMLRTSRYPVEHFYMLTWLDEEWKDPSVLEFPDVEFRPLHDETFGDYLRADIPYEAIQSNINFTLASPMKEGVYLSRLETGSDNYYQLALLPSKIISSDPAKKITLLFDYQFGNSSVNQKEIFSTVKSMLLNNLDDSDSFNLIFSKLNIDRVSDTWMPADDATVNEVFNNLDDEPLANYSNLPALLNNGINFIKNNGDDGSIILISNSDELYDHESANDLINDLLASMNHTLPIHVADYQSQNFYWNHIGGRYYTGNEYFYTNLSRLTSGNFFRITELGNSFSNLVNELIHGVGGFISSFDLYTGLNDGFCYGRYNYNLEGTSIYLNKPIFQVGKYNGDFPFSIETNGVYNSEAFSQSINVPESAVSASDTTLKKLWVGNYIDYLMKDNQTNSIVSEIIHESVTNRVLSQYSAFLCLEPSRGGEVCYNCRDESILVGINNETAAEDTLVLSAYPNPFNNQTKITIQLPAELQEKNVTFKIFNILGQIVKTFELNEPNKTRVELEWNGRNDSEQPVASGSYIFVAESPRKIYSLKLLLVK